VRLWSADLNHALTLTLLPAPLALCRLSPNEPMPTWAVQANTFMCISRTPTELSIVADEEVVPHEFKADRGYRALRVEGPLPPNLVGIFAAIAEPLAAAGVPIFPIATYDTDYVLLRESEVTKAVSALRAVGHSVI
jgi:hypothetical protein